MQDFTINPPKNRLVGAMPKIGIRPTIDGRLGGVRESLEDQTMAMAQSVAKLLIEHPAPRQRPAGGVRDRRRHASAAWPKPAACAEKFRREGVGLSITVTPCWCYGSETMDMDPLMPKAVWGFNGTERPGRGLSGGRAGRPHARRGCRPSASTATTCRTAATRAIPADVAEKLLQFARAGLAVATMRGKSYLSIGGISMGIAGSIVDQPLFERYLGMRVEAVDMSEVIRRIDERHLRPGRVRAGAGLGARRTARRARTTTRPRSSTAGSRRTRRGRTSVKMALIVRDMMVGNPRLAELGFGEEALGHNAIAAGFQGQRQWTDHFPNGDFLEAILNSSFDWNGIREPYIVATENDALNGVCMLFGHLLTGTAQIFADVRTYWSPDAVKRVTGHELTGARGRRHSPPDQLRPGHAGRHRPARARRQAGHEAVLGDQRRRGAGLPGGHHLAHRPSSSTSAAAAGRPASAPAASMPVTMFRLNLVKGLGPALQIAEGWTVDAARRGARRAGRAHQPHLAHHLVRAQRHRRAAPSATSTPS